jgi:5-methylthioadenosine/S-adenosylhomocysteine deaminase
MIARILRSPRARLVLLLIVLVVAAAVAAVYFVALRPAPTFPSILMHGTIITPDAVIPSGWLLIENGRIQQVSEQKPAVTAAHEVETAGLIFPGLIDLHNHVSWNVIPRWETSAAFTNREQWRTDPDYMNRVGNPYQSLIDAGRFCDMNTYGEIRALAGGVTSILATASRGCIDGLARNLDFSSGFYAFPDSDTQHLQNDVFFSTNPEPLRARLNDSRFQAYLIHVAEGTDDAARGEFSQLTSSGLLTAKTAIVHGTALQPDDFQALQAAGASLIWSPRSNIELYGATTDVQAALDAGVRIALAPDWAITGSSNMLDELRYAAALNASDFSDQQLTAMITTIPAAIVGISDKVGAIRPGAYADLLVLSGDSADPYRALVQSDAGDVQLVLVNGMPLYGDPALMAGFWQPADLVSVPVLDGSKALRLPEPFEALQRRLSDALATQNIELAPVAEDVALQS